MNLYSKKIILLVAQIIVGLVFYVLGIFIYTSLVAEPIIFFASCYLALGITAVLGLVWFKLFKQIMDAFTVLLMSLCCGLIILVFAVFGPVFIDRSISYHIAFYAVDEGAVQVNEMQDVLTQSIFDKRIDDATRSGFITANADGSFSPTLKAKLFTLGMKALGGLSHSLENYQSMAAQLRHD